MADRKSASTVTPWRAAARSMAFQTRSGRRMDRTDVIPTSPPALGRPGPTPNVTPAAGMPAAKRFFRAPLMSSRGVSGSEPPHPAPHAFPLPPPPSPPPTPPHLPAPPPHPHLPPHP